MVLDLLAARRRGSPKPSPPARPSRCPRLRRKAAARDDVEVTAALSKPAPPARAGAAQKSTCANPDALGVSRIVVIDTTGGPGFGFVQFKQFDFLDRQGGRADLRRRSVAGNTPAVLKALADECTKAVFFPIGKHATYHPEILKQVAAAGHTIGAHTWSHANLNSKKMTDQLARDEIEKGFSAVKMALGAAPAPFFRFPALAAYAGDAGLSRLAQHRDVLLRSRLLRLQVLQSRAGRSTPS